MANKKTCINSFDPFLRDQNWSMVNIFPAIKYWALSNSSKQKGAAGKTIHLLIVCALYYTDVVSDFKAQTPMLLTINGGHTVELFTILFVKIVLFIYTRKKYVRTYILLISIIKNNFNK